MRFEQCKMSGSSFADARFMAIAIVGGDWSFVILASHDLRGLDLRDVRFNDANLEGCNLARANLRGSDLTNASLLRTRLRGVDLSLLTLRGVRLDLQQAVLLPRSLGAVVDFGG